MNNPPAFPFACDEAFNKGGCADGMTLRDYFAAAVIPSIYTLCMNQPEKELGAEYQANCAYILADAMLKAREQ